MPTLQQRFDALQTGDTLQLEKQEYVDGIVVLKSKSHVTVKGPSVVTGPGRIQVSSCVDTTVRDIDFQDMSDTGLLFWVGSKNRVENIRCYGVSTTTDRPSVQLWHQNQGSFRDFIITNNLRMGVLVSSCTKCIVRGVNIVCPQGFCQGRMMKIQSSSEICGGDIIIEGGAFTGLSLHQIQDCVLNNIVSTHNGQEGVWFSGAGSTGNILTGVLSYGNGSYDLAIHGPDDTGNVVHAVKAPSIYNPQPTKNKIIL